MAITHWTSAAAQVRGLAKAVAQAFAESGLTVEERSVNIIQFTDLQWQVPPLRTPLILCGAEMQDFFDAPIALEEDKLHKFWIMTLDHLWNSPSRAVRRQAFVNCGWAMPKVKGSQRAFRFSVPAGWPGSMDENAGFVFSLEVAHTASTSCPGALLTHDESNYYATLRSGEVVGVRNGRVAHAPSPWAHHYNGSGHIDTYLSMGRGEVSHTCQYDQIAALRSVLYTHPDNFPNNFEALDLALQALRYMTLGQYCPELQREMMDIPMSQTAQATEERNLRDAIEIIAVNNLSDRQKLQTIQNILVPAFMSLSRFRREIFGNPHFPFTAAQGKMDQIQAWLYQEYKRRIPADMRKLGETK